MTLEIHQCHLVDVWSGLTWSCYRAPFLSGLSSLHIDCILVNVNSLPSVPIWSMESAHHTLRCSGFLFGTKHAIP